MDRYPHRRAAIAAFITLGFASLAHAWEFRARFIERVGAADILLNGNSLNASSGAARNIRIQFGVFDDANGPAPAGGFVGWNIGSIIVSGPADNSDERRNNGRIAPFNFGPGSDANGNPPLPGGDPFTMLTGIDATLGVQLPVWLCDANGDPLPMPLPTIRGLNTFVSVYAFQVDPRANASSYGVIISGNLIAATQWRTVGAPTPPDCPDPNDPDPPPPESVTYVPLTAAPRSFTSTLTVVVPGPSAFVLALPTCLVACRRTRRSA